MQNNAKWLLLKDHSDAVRQDRNKLLKDLYDYYRADNGKIRHNTEAAIKLISERIEQGLPVTFHALTEAVTTERQNAARFEGNVLALGYSEAKIRVLTAAALICAFLVAK